MDSWTFHKTASREYLDTTRWYVRRNPRAANAFLDEFDRCLSLILSHPEAAPLATGRGSRAKSMGHNFKYTIYYAIEPDRIRVLAIAHQNRRPFYWIRREVT